jgi:hypothetical protein
MTERMTRRGFFAVCGRVGALAGLGAIVARLAGREAGKGSSARNAGLCGRCPALGTCVLPDGAKTRLERGPDASERQESRGGASGWDGRGLCGVPQPESPSLRWTRREET